MRKPLNDTDSAPANTEPVRRCILTGQSAYKSGLLRLALSPGGEIAPDVRAQAPGRGAWVTLDRAAFVSAHDKGKLKGALARAFKGAPFAIPQELPGQIDAALERVLLDRLGLEARTGKLLTGSDKINVSARTGQVTLLMHAADAGEDGNRKLDQAWRIGRDAEGSKLRGLVLPIDRSPLSMALGRENTVHMALTDHAAARRIELCATRLILWHGGTVDTADYADNGQVVDDSASYSKSSGDQENRANVAGDADFAVDNEVMKG